VTHAVAAFTIDPADELGTEKARLLKAQHDIEEGWKRLRNQQDLLQDLGADGHDTKQAEYLVRLLKQILVEWEQHRILIEQRVAYLQEQLFPRTLAGRR
jgi:hypothetical protein